MASEKHSVQLWIYDLTQGMARVLSPMLLGEVVEGVWHTSIVVHDVEWFFGAGVQRAVPGTTPFGQPLQRLPLGETEITEDLLIDMVADVGATSFRPEQYSLLTNNCNHFTDTLAKLLVDQGIPEHILKQHEVLLRSPMGAQLMPLLTQMEGTLSGAAAGQPPPDHHHGAHATSAASAPPSQPTTTSAPAASAAAAAAAATTPNGPAAASPAAAAAAAAEARAAAAGKPAAPAGLGKGLH